MIQCPMCGVSYGIKVLNLYVSTHSFVKCKQFLVLDFSMMTIKSM